MTFVQGDFGVTYFVMVPHFYEGTKHIEVRCHFIRDVVVAGKISMPCILGVAFECLHQNPSKKVTGVYLFQVGMIDIYAPTWELGVGVLDIVIYF